VGSKKRKPPSSEKKKEGGELFDSPSWGKKEPSVKKRGRIRGKSTLFFRKKEKKKRERGREEHLLAGKEKKTEKGVLSRLPRDGGGKKENRSPIGMWEKNQGKRVIA